MNKKAYQTTSTPVAKSQEEIRRILSRYGADGVQFSEDWKNKTLSIRFLFSITGIQYSVLFKIPIPEADTSSPTGRRRKSNQVEQLQEQLERGIWRAAFWAIKSRMEAVDFGIETFQEAFLSHFEVPGTDKQIGDILIPRLSTGNLKLLEGNKYD